MADIHVEDFFKDLAKILARLYASFPRRATVFVEDLVGADEPDEFGMHSERHLACFAALLWLADEGYLRFEATIRQEAIDQAVLTARCFSALCSVAPGESADDPTLPDSIRLEHRTTIYRLREAVKSQSSALLRSIVVDLMSRMNESR
jgi:hypothetical protein